VAATRVLQHSRRPGVGAARDRQGWPGGEAAGQGPTLVWLGANTSRGGRARLAGSCNTPRRPGVGAAQDGQGRPGGEATRQGPALVRPEVRGGKTWPVGRLWPGGWAATGRWPGIASAGRGPRCARGRLGRPGWVWPGGRAAIGRWPGTASAGDVGVAEHETIDQERMPRIRSKNAHVNVYTISEYLIIAMCLTAHVICYCNLQCHMLSAC
jgi:hypothetical protein